MKYMKTIDDLLILQVTDLRKAINSRLQVIESLEEEIRDFQKTIDITKNLSPDIDWENKDELKGLIREEIS